MPIFEEPGLSKEEFSDAQAALGKEASRYAGRERERKSKLYFEFDSPGTRDWAMATLRELRKNSHEHDDRFRFYIDCKVDPERPDIGMEIEFSKNPESLRKDFEQLLAERGIVPQEEYKTGDGEPRPEETQISRAA